MQFLPKPKLALEIAASIADPKSILAFNYAAEI